MTTRSQIGEVSEMWLEGGLANLYLVRLTQELKSGTCEAKEVKGLLYSLAMLLSTLLCLSMLHLKSTAQLLTIRINAF